MLQNKQFESSESILWNKIDSYLEEGAKNDIKNDENKLKPRNTFRISECTFSTLNANVDNPDDDW